MTALPWLLQEPHLFWEMWTILGGTLAFCIAWLAVERIRG